MLMEQVITVREKWNSACDGAIHNKPKFIECMRDKFWLSDLETVSEILAIYQFTAESYKESDGSITLSLNEIDLVENGENEEEAKINLAKSILEYSLDYYNNYDLYSHSPNRKKHIPYIFKTLIIDNLKEIGNMIQCQNG